MKPRFSHCTPQLPVGDLEATLEYYRDKLGFTDGWKFGERDGGASRDDLRMLFAEDKEFVLAVNNKDHKLPLMWFVKNIDEVLLQFKSSNIVLADDLRLHPYGLKEFAFVDINGYYIRVAEAAE
jgi:catechol 2,3-dioxygenase-like lactoylglutathione lyase family enzyme